jgi:hypothetical protein
MERVVTPSGLGLKATVDSVNRFDWCLQTEALIEPFRSIDVFSKWPNNRLLVQLPTVKPVSGIAEEFHLVSSSSESSTEYRCKFSLKSALQYEIAFNLTAAAF